MSVGPGLLPTPSGGFVHHLLRARDWQDRPEFGELCQWWKDGGVGVCALVGIGGAGKTAITERFLQVLPGGYPPHPKVPKDQSLTAPARLLVFSFYDAPNPDTFFTTLAAWLEGRPLDPEAGSAGDGTARPPSYYQTLELLARAGKCLLVLDGLEKVQDDGSRGGAFGQILDGRLRDFVVRVADGYLPQVALVITSRFRLYDPLASRVWYYRQVDVERLQPPAAVQLLRDRGVRGTDEELQYVAREQGFHALSVDLAGGYIARFCGGDPQRFSSIDSTPPETEEVASPSLDPRIAALREQERKFARLTEQYRYALAQSDPAALALLQRICLFRLGVEAKTLASIFTGEGKESISGPSLAALNQQQLQAALQLLIEMRLIEASKSQMSNHESQIYTIHPAVRDGFLRTLSVETARLSHDAARQGLESSLGSKSADNPTDLATLDLLEEIVYHTLAAGHTQEAFNIFDDKMSLTLFALWGMYERLARISEEFLQHEVRQTLSLNDYYNLLEIKSLALMELGQLDGALGSLSNEVGLEDDIRVDSVILQTLILTLAGDLKTALDRAEDVVRLANKPQAEYAIKAHVLTQLGDIEQGKVEFAKAYVDEESLPVWFGVWHIQFLCRLGSYNHALNMIGKMEKVLIDESQDAFLNHCKLLRSDIALALGDRDASSESLQQVREWALQHGSKELLCWSAMLQAKIELFDLPSHNNVRLRARFGHAAAALENGLRVAHECGYGIYHIDLLLVRAQLALHEGRAADAERDVRVALDEGVHPPAESGFP
ncbi:MAG TPA: hypothetical protein VLX28_20615, partial [Thermoanaerobaculia bacterium]|nr:hypothetical protein [Thermoanaerobaculia bacterium]